MQEQENTKVNDKYSLQICFDSESDYNMFAKYVYDENGMASDFEKYKERKSAEEKNIIR